MTHLATAISSHPAKESNEPFVKVHNAYIGRLLDQKYSAYALHLLAIKLGGKSEERDYVLNETVCSRDFGIGERKFRAGINLLCRTRVLDRSKNGGNAANSGRRFASEKLTPVAPGYVAIPKSLLSKDSKVVGFYLACGVSTKAQPAGDIAARLGIKSHTTTMKIVDQLADLIEVRVVYGLPLLVARKGHVFETSDDLDSAKNVGDRNVGGRNVATHLAESKNIKLREDHQAASSGSYPSPVRERLTTAKDEMQQAWASPNVLAGLDDDFAAEVDSVDDASVEAIAALASDAELASRLRTATRGRVSQELLAPAGLYGLRWLAAFVMVTSDSDGDPYDPTGALAYVLESIDRRIGSSRRKPWLNALAVIAKRLFGSARKSGLPDRGLYAARGPSERTPNTLLAALAEIVEADGAKTIADEVLADTAGLRRLLRRHGSDARETIKRVLVRAMRDGMAIGSITSWGYFKGPIADDLRAAQMQRLGLRPGDCFGNWRAA